MPLRQVSLRHQIDAKISVESDDIQYGLVPEFEEREAAIFAVCPWHIWIDLPWEDRSAAVAHYRLHLLVEAHVNEAAQSEAASPQR